MIKIKIISPGKIREKWLTEAIQEYVKRLTPVAQIEFIFPKDDKEFAKCLLAEKALICLDPGGKMFSSEEFSTFLFKQAEHMGASLVFAIGGAEGYPKGIPLNHFKLSFSPMTFTHQMTRLLLIEQIFRAFEIDKGSKYHK